MKKVSLLLGTLGGAMGAYLLSNKDLRKELMNAKDPEAAAKTLGKHLQKDSKKLVKEAKALYESDDVQKNMDKAKKFAIEKMEEAKKSMQAMVKKGSKKATSTMKKDTAAVKKTVKKAVKKVAKKADSMMPNVPKAA